MPLRDPNGVSVARFTSAAALVAVLIGLDIAFRGGRRRWTPARVLAVVSALVSFYVTYLAYRNLKSVVPLLRPDELFDAPARRPRPRACSPGSDPAALLHSVLGTRDRRPRAVGRLRGCSSSSSRSRSAFALVVLPNLRAGLFSPPRSSLNWVLAAGELLPAAVARADLRRAGRVRRAPDHRRDGHLQALLLEQRMEFLRDPAAAGPRRASAPSPRCTSRSSSPPRWRPTCWGFGRYVKIAVWVLFALTVAATIYLGWHYVARRLRRPGDRRDRRSRWRACSPGSTCAPLREQPAVA